ARRVFSCSVIDPKLRDPRSGRVGVSHWLSERKLVRSRSLARRRHVKPIWLSRTAHRRQRPPHGCQNRCGCSPENYWDRTCLVLFLSQSDEFGCSGKQTCSSLRILRHTRPSGKSDDFLGVNSGATNQYPCNHHPQNSGLWLTAACL